MRLLQDGAQDKFSCGGATIAQSPSETRAGSVAGETPRKNAKLRCLPEWRGRLLHQPAEQCVFAWLASSSAVSAKN